jgi:DNA-directed RNA polymerase subunit RPC12/RpoP
MGREPIPPILLGEVREAHRALSVRCPRCKHEVEVEPMALALPDDLDMDQVGHRLRCTACGRRGGHTVYPEPAGWVRWVRAKGWKHREPWFAPMIRGEP